MLAREGLAHKEIPVGALLFDPQNGIIAESSNFVERNQQPLDHAECVVLRTAGERLGHRNFHNLVLFSSLEPCQFCTEACTLYRVGRCVFGAYNTNKVYRPPEHWIGGVLELENGNLLLEAFNRK